MSQPAIFGVPIYENPILPKDTIIVAPPGSVEFHPTSPVVFVGNMAIALARLNLEKKP